MGSRTNRAIDYSINKKLESSLAIKSPRKQLSRLINYCAVKKYDAVKSEGLIDELLSVNSAILEKDIYNNEVCDFLNYKLAKSQSRFNLLRLFKPGEILNSISGVC